MNFDVRGFMNELGASLRPFASQAGAQAATIVGRIRVLEADTEATLQALQKETDPDRRDALQEDLETFLPDRKAFVMSAAESMAGTTAHAMLEAALTVAIKAAVAVGKSMLPIPLP